jgi:glycosyltransferase involved in cell wall biosynthesis
MRILVDARPAVSPGRSGIGEYTLQLLRRLPVVDPQDTFIAWYLNARLSRRPGRSLGVASGNARLRSSPIPARVFEILSQRWELPRVEWTGGLDLVFAPNFVPPPTRKPVVMTVHDLAFRRFPETAPHATRRWLARLERYLPSAARIIAVSECTKQDLVELYGVTEERVAVIPHGVDHSVFRPVSGERVERVRHRLGVDGPYVLSLGGIEPRKNLPNLIRAFAGLDAGPDLRLVLAGSGVPWNPEGPTMLREALEELPPAARRRIVLAGYVPAEDRVALLSGAQALVYPSLYEGFGLPILEAMACGTPVVTSNVSAMPEVAGGAAELVDPRDVHSIAAGIDRVVRRDDLRQRLRAAGLERAAAFDWDETARRTAAILRQSAG